MHIAVGADQGGFELKGKIIEHLVAQNYQALDFGIHELKSIDYPDIAESVARTVANGEAERGIIVCATGLGVSMAANKVRGIRAAVCTDCYMARMAREHNDAQILCLGGRVIGVGLALAIVDVFLTTEAQGGRHARRVGKINALDEKEK
ncbi:MAG: ribose 5-phosphate isomerase B [Anaerolineae bacterium]|nr:ribose 5-phosphate isomerase B [Anaerolineae bacterium]